MCIKPIQIVLFIIWLAVVVSFLLGISLPMASVERFIVIKHHFSLVSALGDLARHPSGQNITLLLIVVVFTLIFPMAKLATMFLQIRYYGRNWHNRMTDIIETLGHFSMLEVFIMALMVLLLKLRMLVEVRLQAGFYWFALSMVLTIGLALVLKKLRLKTLA